MQLLLPIALHDDAVFENFFIGGNAHLVTLLKNFTESFIFCFGPTGAGRSHLLQACCHAHHFFYLPLACFSSLSPSIFESLEDQPGVCIDDVDAVLGDRAWEEALFYFYNRAQANNVKLLMSAKLPPQQLVCVLQDLHSRLSSALSVPVTGLTDTEKTQVLKMRANLRGFSLRDEVVHFLLTHFSRSTADLFSMLDVLDRASLTEKRKITIPFVKKFL